MTPVEFLQGPGVSHAMARRMNSGAVIHPAAALSITAEDRITPPDLVHLLRASGNPPQSNEVRPGRGRRGARQKG